MPEQEQSNGAFYMVITLKSGTQIKTKVTEYKIGKSAIGELQHIKWVTADDSETNLRYFDMDQVAAVHTEWIQNEAAPASAYAVGPPEPGER